MASLVLLPVRTGSAAENMAADFLLLRRWPGPREAPRLRHYGWRSPAATYGYRQHYEEVRSALPEAITDLCRRPTGGGIVDHREDWTYALVLPATHPAGAAPAGQTYRLVHTALAEALADLGAHVELNREPRPPSNGPAACFPAAEIDDLVLPDSGRKVAGAAQKRTREGLLLQGSVDNRGLGLDLDWDNLAPTFHAVLARHLQADPSETAWPDWDEEEQVLADHYSSEDWLARR
ncbi:MAG: lipoate--protein ligase family protein [Puniceicoccaceae bacterium]|nr:MAG: lipoate--protein ligase family protein [Puniceicoccaceae bacterium]